MTAIDRNAVLARLDEKACLDFLSAMVRHKSYSQTDGERTHVAPFSRRYGPHVVPATQTDRTLNLVACVGKQVTEIVPGRDHP